LRQPEWDFWDSFRLSHHCTGGGEWSPNLCAPLYVERGTACGYIQEMALGVALERGEHVDMGFEIEVPANAYHDSMAVS